jgi:hypothetical protein
VKVAKDMDMIFYSIYFMKHAIFVFYYSPDIFIQVLFVSVCNSISSEFCAEDDVIEDLPVTAHRFLICSTPPELLIIHGVPPDALVSLQTLWCPSRCSGVPPDALEVILVQVLSDLAVFLILVQVLWDLAVFLLFWFKSCRTWRYFFYPGSSPVGLGGRYNASPVGPGVRSIG